MKKIGNNYNKILINNLENKTYTWRDSYIKFLDNFKMDAFGEGNYQIISIFKIITELGGYTNLMLSHRGFRKLISIGIKGETLDPNKTVI